jgi:hypothetical protein
MPADQPKEVGQEDSKMTNPHRIGSICHTLYILSSFKSPINPK